jgi:biotin synthase
VPASGIGRAHRRQAGPCQGRSACTLLSIKTGGCPEDCGYCPQAARYDTGVEAEKLMPPSAVVAKARSRQGRRCRLALLHGRRLALAEGPRHRRTVAAMIREVKALGLETCATLGMLSASRRRQLKDAGLDYYNHNLDCAPEFYGEIIQHPRPTRIASTP